MPNRKERIAASLGAAIGLIGTEYYCRWILSNSNLWFIAPMGASAVLLFAVPSSPLAQPWSIIGGNFIAALVGVTCASFIGYVGVTPGIAAGVAVAVAIGLMFRLRCVHPPSGAVALTAVFGGPAVSKLGYGFVLYPVMANSLFLALLALLFNNVVGRRYPHHAPPPTSLEAREGLPGERVGVRREDIHAVLSERGDFLDIDEGDLQEILLQAEVHAHRRRFGNLRCSDFMTRDLATIRPDALCADAISILQRHQYEVLPVTADDGALLGIVTAQDLLSASQSHHGQTLDCTVAAIMRKQFHTSDPDDAVEQLVLPLSNQSKQCSLVVDRVGRLIGLVTASDALAALYQEQLETEYNLATVR